MKVFVTGASGFIGRALVQALLTSGARVSGLVRSGRLDAAAPTMLCHRGDLTDISTWEAVLAGQEVVVHLAARAHVLNDKRTERVRTEFMRVNRDATLELARASVKAGVRRFVFLSTIGVNGGASDQLGFDEDSPSNPESAYAQAKYEAEIGLRQIANESSLEVVIIRPPLVYAYDAPGNFGRLLRLIGTGVPLPFGNVDNRRSLVSLENLVDFLVLCVRHPAAANETFLISDNDDVSLCQLVVSTASGMGKRPSLVPLPHLLLKGGLVCIGRRDLYDKLCRDLVIRSDKAKSTLGWMPVIGSHEALKACGQRYVEHKSG